MKRAEILEKAKRCVTGDREQDYGSPENNFKIIAEFWSAYTGCEIKSKDVAAMLALMKIARIKSGHAKSDNWIDLAGYAACGGEIEDNVTDTREETIAEPKKLTNKERYKDKIVEIGVRYLAVLEEGNIPVRCSGSICQRCLFKHSKDCRTATEEWAEQEAE